MLACALLALHLVDPGARGRRLPLPRDALPGRARASCWRSSISTRRAGRGCATRATSRRSPCGTARGTAGTCCCCFRWAASSSTTPRDRVLRRAKAVGAARAELEKLRGDIARQEDVFVLGPAARGGARQARDGAGFFHVEMFEALPGMRAGLYREREMENAYAKALGQPREPDLREGFGRALGSLHGRRLPGPEALRRERRRPSGEAGGGREGGRASRARRFDRAVSADASSPCTTTRWRWRSSEAGSPPAPVPLRQRSRAGDADRGTAALPAGDGPGCGRRPAVSHE